MSFTCGISKNSMYGTQDTKITTNSSFVISYVGILIIEHNKDLVRVEAKLILVTDNAATH